LQRILDFLSLRNLLSNELFFTFYEFATATFNLIVFVIAYFYFIAVSRASSIISLNVFSLSSELVISGLTKESEIVNIERAFALYLLAKVYSAAV